VSLEGGALRLGLPLPLPFDYAPAVAIPIDLDLVRELDAKWVPLMGDTALVARRFARSREEARDLMNQAYLTLREGKRTWDRTKHPNLFTLICSVLGSLSTHKRDSAAARNETPLKDGEDVAPSSAPNPEQLAVLFEKDKSRVNALAKLRAKDPLIDELIPHMEAGVTSSALQAERLGVPVEKIYAAHRRLWYLLTKLEEDRS
jgi:hypothetical protein